MTLTNPDQFRKEYPEKYSEQLKNKSLNMMSKAWDAFDSACDGVESSSYDTLHQDIFNSLHFANNALCIMYSGSANAQSEFAILKHLITERHLCFKNCHLEFFKSYNKFINNPSAIFNKKKLSKEFRKFIDQTENILKSVESYNFYLNKKVFYTKEEHQALNRKQKKIAFWCAGVVLFLLLLFPVYKYLDPIQIYQTQGQIFWKATLNDGESEANSLRFKVHGDDEFHDYVISAIEPINCSSIRFDPVTEKNVRIWIDYIEIFSNDLEKPLRYNFSDKTDGWVSSNNTTKLTIFNGSLFFKTTGADPVLRKNKIAVNQVYKIKIRMKVLLYKTYIQWIFS